MSYSDHYWENTYISIVVLCSSGFVYLHSVSGSEFERSGIRRMLDWFWIYNLEVFNFNYQFKN